MGGSRRRRGAERMREDLSLRDVVEMARKRHEDHLLAGRAGSAVTARSTHRAVVPAGPSDVTRRTCTGVHYAQYARAVCVHARTAGMRGSAWGNGIWLTSRALPLSLPHSLSLSLARSLPTGAAMQEGVGRLERRGIHACQLQSR